MNTRKIGKKSENYFCETLKNLDTKTKLTKNSGANSQKGDILSQFFLCEVKKRNTVNLSINLKVWEKLCKEIKVGTLRLPLLCLENVWGKKFAVLEFNDFCIIVREFLNAKGVSNG
jgi:hypothetical protein